MKYKVSFQYSENVFCTNIAIADDEQSVYEHYSEYPWVSVKPASEGEYQTALAKGMPIITA